MNSALQLVHLPASGARPVASTHPPASALSRSLVTNHQVPVAFVFSTTYELPIFYLLSFDIHASDGGCTPLPTFRRSNVSTFKRSTIYLLSSHTLPNSFALFCIFLHLRKTQLVSYQAIPHSFTKTPGGGGPQGIAGSRVPQSWKCQVRFDRASASFGRAFFRLTIGSGSWRERACTISTLPPRVAGAYSDSVFAFR
jgi:hypothetical protein